MSWVFTVAVVAASYILFGYIQWEQSRILSAYNFKIDCAIVYNSAVDWNLYSDALYAQNNAQYNHCFCTKNYFTLNISQLVVDQCSTWWKSYLLYLAIPVFISLGLVMYNLIVSIIFKKITQW